MTNPQNKRKGGVMGRATILAAAYLLHPTYEANAATCQEALAAAPKPTQSVRVTPTQGEDGRIIGVAPATQLSFTCTPGTNEKYIFYSDTGSYAGDAELLFGLWGIRHASYGDPNYFKPIADALVTCTGGDTRQVNVTNPDDLTNKSAHIVARMNMCTPGSTDGTVKITVQMRPVELYQWGGYCAVCAFREVTSPYYNNAGLGFGDNPAAVPAIITRLTGTGTASAAAYGGGVPDEACSMSLSQNHMEWDNIEQAQLAQGNETTPLTKSVTLTETCTYNPASTTGNYNIRDEYYIRSGNGLTQSTGGTALAATTLAGVGLRVELAHAGAATDDAARRCASGVLLIGENDGYGTSCILSIPGSIRGNTRPSAYVPSATIPSATGTYILTVTPALTNEARSGIVAGSGTGTITINHWYSS